MTQSVFNDDNWIDIAKQRADALGITLQNQPGTGLSFHAVNDPSILGVRNTNIRIGGVLLSKVSLTEIFSGIQIDVLRVIGTEAIALMGPEVIVRHALAMAGLTGVTPSDFDYVVGTKIITCTAKSTCTKFTGTFEVIYAG